MCLCCEETPCRSRSRSRGGASGCPGEFLELPEKPRAEWVDGEAVIQATPPADGEWEQIAHLDDRHPTAEVELAGVAVPLEIDAILRR